MAYTYISDIINPEVLADQISAKFPDYLVLGNSDLVEVDGEFPLGQPGTQFKIPFWKRIGPFQALTEGTAMTPGKISTDAEFAIVQRAGTALEVLDTAELVSKADPVGEIADQLARRAAEFIDGALVTEFQKTPNTYNNITGVLSVTNGGRGAAATTTTLTPTNANHTLDQNAIVLALTGTLGDNYGKVARGGVIICHSKVFGDLLQTAAIQNQYQSGMDVIRTGTIPTLMGLPIYVSDLVTVNSVSGVNQYNTYIVGKGCLGLFYQRQVMVEFDRDILLQADVIASNVHFAPHLFGYDDGSGLSGAGAPGVVAEQSKSIHAVLITTN